MAPDEPDTLVPDPQVRREFGGIGETTLVRWTQDPELDFPPVIKIFTRNFRSRRALEEFKLRMATRRLAKAPPPPGSYRRARQRKQKRGART
jgi:hypothetical protein